MHRELQHNDKTYLRIGDTCYATARHLGAPLAIAREVDARLRSLSPPDKPTKKTRTSILTEGSEDSSFHHIDTFPIIAAIIRDHCRQESGYITHHEIVTAFLVHPEGHTLAQQAATQQGNPIGQTASNIVAWFSKRFTEGQTPYQDEFERERQDERWAYRTTTPD